MKFIPLLILSLSALSVHAKDVFIPENGRYDLNIQDVARSLKASGINYVELKGFTGGQYKLDIKRNEYIIKDWFRQDWYSLQDMWAFNQTAFINSQSARTFNEAKRNQFRKFVFDKKKYFHYKTTPAMKEWGGLTHPPVKSLSMPLEKYDSNFAPINYKTVSSPYFRPELQKEVDRVSKSELSFGNIVTPLADRYAFEKKKSLIRNARESILMSSLVFVCDASTKSLVNLLIQKHNEGVDVKILTDGFIDKILFHTECLKIMRRAGIEVVETKDFFRHKLKAIYHTKTLVVDMKEAVAGGHNMIDADNTSKSVDFKNRDIDVHVVGPMVTDIVKQFVENWNYQATLNKKLQPLRDYADLVVRQLLKERMQGLRGQSLYEKILSNPETRMKGVCRFIKQAPYEDRHTIGKAYLSLLNKVEKHLVITDPVKSDTLTTNMAQAPLAEKFDNFDMFNLLHNKVQMVAKSGKKIDYITTNINMAGNENVAMMNERIKEQLDAGKNMWANWSLAKLNASNSYYGKPHYKNLLTDWMPIPSVHVWTHVSFMHSKIFYFDRIVASVGSLNFQHNATDQAYESTVICQDENMNRKLDVILVEDMANSIPLIFSAQR